MARRFTMEMDKVKMPLVLVKNIGDHLLFAVVRSEERRVGKEC